MSVRRTVSAACLICVALASGLPPGSAADEPGPEGVVLGTCELAGYVLTFHGAAPGPLRLDCAAAGDLARVRTGANTIEIECASGELTLNGKPHGTLRRTDRVALDARGRLFVNGARRAGGPAPPPRPEPPAADPAAFLANLEESVADFEQVPDARRLVAALAEGLPRRPAFAETPAPPVDLSPRRAAVAAVLDRLFANPRRFGTQRVKTEPVLVLRSAVDYDAGQTWLRCAVAEGERAKWSWNSDARLTGSVALSGRLAVEANGGILADLSGSVGGLRLHANGEVFARLSGLKAGPISAQSNGDMVIDIGDNPTLELPSVNGTGFVFARKPVGGRIRLRPGRPHRVAVIEY